MQFLKWLKEIHAEETRREFQRREGKKKFLTVRKRLSRVIQHQKNVRPILIFHAIRRNTQWLVKGDGYKAPLIFLKSTAPIVERLIDSVNSAGKKVNVVLICKMMKTDPATGKTTYTVAHFRSKTHTMFDNVRDEYTIICDRVLENFANFQRRGSGWQLHSIEGLEIFIMKFDSVQGKSYAPFPECVVKKKAVVNMENNDDQCFKWAVTRALPPVDRDAGQVSRILRKQSEDYNWNGLEFPVKVKDIHVFETNNRINVNVFSYDDYTGKVYTLRISSNISETVVNLFYFNEHYGVIKNLSRLVSSQKVKTRDRNLFACAV